MSEKSCPKSVPGLTNIYMFNKKCNGAKGQRFNA